MTSHATDDVTRNVVQALIPWRLLVDGRDLSKPEWLGLIQDAHLQHGWVRHAERSFYIFVCPFCGVASWLFTFVCLTFDALDDELRGVWSTAVGAAHHVACSLLGSAPCGGWSVGAAHRVACGL
jgi:hypothetical protein